jgi:hypothetical protein
MASFREGGLLSQYSEEDTLLAIGEDWRIELAVPLAGVRCGGVMLINI